MEHTPDTKENKEESCSNNRMKRISFGKALIYKHTPSPSELTKPKPKGQRHVEERTINFNDSLTQSETPTITGDSDGGAQAAASAVWRNEDKEGKLRDTEHSLNLGEQKGFKSSRSRSGTPRPAKAVERSSKVGNKGSINDILQAHGGNDGIWGFVGKSLSREPMQLQVISSRGQAEDVQLQSPHDMEKKGAIWDFEGGLSNTTDKRGKQALDNLLQSDERSTTSRQGGWKPSPIRRRSTPTVNRYSSSLSRRNRQKSLPVLRRDSSKRKIPLLDLLKRSPQRSRTPSGKSSRVLDSHPRSHSLPPPSSRASSSSRSDRRSVRSSSKQSIGSFFGAKDPDIDVTRHHADIRVNRPERSSERADVSDHEMELEMPPELEDIPKIASPESDMDLEEEHAPEDPFEGTCILPKRRSSSGASLEGILKNSSLKKRKLTQKRKKRQSMPNVFRQKPSQRRRFSMPPIGQQQDSPSDVLESQFMLQKDDYTMSKMSYPCELPNPIDSDPDLQSLKRPRRKSMQSVNCDMTEKDVGPSYNLVQEAAEKWAETSFKNQYLSSFITNEESSADISSTTNTTNDLSEQRKQIGTWRHKSGKTSGQIIDDLMGGPMFAPRLSTQPVESQVQENTEIIKWNALIGHKYSETEKLFSEAKKKKIEQFITETKRLQDVAKYQPSPLVVRYANADEVGKRKIRKQINTYNQICALEADIEGKQLLVKERYEKIVTLKERVNELSEKKASKQRLLKEVRARVKSGDQPEAHSEDSYLAKRARRTMMEKAERIQKLQAQLQEVELKNSDKDLRLRKAKEVVHEAEANLAKFKTTLEAQQKQKEEREQISTSIKRYYKLTGLFVSTEVRKLVVLALWRFKHTFTFNEDNSIADCTFDVLKDDVNNPLMPASERNYVELLEQVVPRKADLLGGPNFTSKKDINLSKWSQHICRCRSLVKELVELRDRAPYCLDARVELEPKDDETNTVDATVSIHLAKKGSTLDEFREHPVAIIWVSLQGLENYPTVIVSKHFVHIASLGIGESKDSMKRMDLEKVVLSELVRVKPGVAYVHRLYRTAWKILQENYNSNED